MPTKMPTFIDGFDPDDPKSIGLALVRLDGAMVAMHRANETSNHQQMQGIADVRSEVRRLSDTLDALKPLAQRSADAGEQLNRVWKHIEKMDARRDADKAEHEAAIGMTRSRVDRIAFVALGISIAASALSGIVYKTQSDNDRLRESSKQATELRIDAARARVDAVDDRVQRMEIHMAGDPARPYKR